LDEHTHNIDSNNLTTGFLDLVQLTEVVPESRLCDDIVGSKDSHPVQLGRGLIRRRKMSSNDLILDERRHDFWWFGRIMARSGFESNRMVSKALSIQKHKQE
jgi:hypothetical protein